MPSTLSRTNSGCIAISCSITFFSSSNSDLLDPRISKVAYLDAVTQAREPPLGDLGLGFDQRGRSHRLDRERGGNRRALQGLDNVRAARISDQRAAAERIARARFVDRLGDDRGNGDVVGRVLLMGD